MHAQLDGRAGGLAERIASLDEAATFLGDMRDWPLHAKSIVALVLDAAAPMVAIWGSDGVAVYNDAYARLIGAPGLALVSANAFDGVPELRDWHRRLLALGLAGESACWRDERLALDRQGYPETLWLDVDLGPIRAGEGPPVGVLAVVREAAEPGRTEKDRDAQLLEKLHTAQARQRCLVELGDTLRGCETPWQISGAVSQILGRALRCARTGYAVISGEHAIVENDWTNGTLASLSGQHKFSALGPRYVNEIRSGKILTVPDVQTHEALAESAHCWPDIGVRALLNVPLLDNGAPVSLLYAHEAQPREWSSDEVSLVKEVADRAWEAMGRARAVAALRRMNETLETQVRERTLQRDRIWSLSTDIMMITNIETEILSVNPAATRLLGWSEDEMLGASFYDFVHPEDLASTQDARRQLEQGLSVEKFENRYRASDGRFLWLSWKSAPDGEFIHSVARDVTAEREHAEALRAAEDALRQAQKMEAVGQLTGGIAHDFNNLLQGILGALSLSEKRIEQGQFEQLAKYNAQARSAAERASALTHRLLAFSRRQPLDPKPVEINALVLAMEPLLRRTVGESILIDFELTRDSTKILCDANQLDSAILNLAINARDAMPNGGRLTIRTEALAETLEVRLSVTDTGTGMPRDVAERAFDPFYTTKPIGQGTGLGLSMVYGFMKQSGGGATIQSSLNVGTTVSLIFPSHAEQELGESAPANPTEASAAPMRGEGTVLVVEDEFAVRCLIVEVLEELGFEIIEAEDGPSGLEILQSPRRIDLLVTDIGLPGLNGRQISEAARLLRPQLKILFMTGYSDIAVMSEGFLTAGMEMIPKPFKIDALVQRVHQLAGA